MTDAAFILPIELGETDYVGNGRRARLTITQGSCWWRYVGTVEDLISVGLITAGMLPEGRKRVKYCEGGVLPDYDFWVVRKKRHPLVEATLHLYMDRCLPKRPEYRSLAEWRFYKQRCLEAVEAGFDGSKPQPLRLVDVENSEYADSLRL